MKPTHATLVGLTSSAISLGLLFVLYPWSVYFGNFTFGAWSTFASYLMLALLVGAIVAAVAAAVTHIPRIPDWGRIAFAAFLSFLLLFTLSLILGPVGVDVFETRVRGIFFAEWKFITFDLYVALPISILNATLILWIIRWKRQSSGNAATMDRPHV